MRERTAYYIHPLDFEGDVGIGLTLPLTNDPAAVSKYSVEDNGLLAHWAQGQPYDNQINPITGLPYDPPEVGNPNTFTGSATNAAPLHPSVKVQGGFHVSYTTTEQAKSNLKNLVLTNRGERVMHPEFGCDVWKSVFQNNTKALREEIRERIILQSSIWLPYINIKNVGVEQPKKNENRMDIKIEFGLYDNDALNPEVIVMRIGEL